jgi:peptidoglycan hydrolase-like protein with peptidoglycan-binding domain
VSSRSDAFEHPRRDLAAEELWRRSLTRSQERRTRAAAGAAARRSLISAAIADLDAPHEYRGVSAPTVRDLSDPELWDFSRACAQAKRAAAQKGFLQQARAASAPLIVAAVAGLAAAQSNAHPRARGSDASQADKRLLKFGSRGADVKAVQRALGVTADGVFGPQTRAAVRAFQAKSGLLVDGVVGPKTRAALFGSGSGRFIRAWWVIPVQRALGIPADGLYGPQSRAAVRAYQARHGLAVDGVVGPETLSHLGINRQGVGHDHQGSTNPQPSQTSGPASISRALWDELALAKRMGLRLISGYRPGATIAGGGGTSDHSRYPSRAIDVAGSPAAMRNYARRIAGRSQIKYIIYSPLGIWGNWNRTWSPVSGATRADHYSHVHVSSTG